jgi:hypothetical protein
MILLLKRLVRWFARNVFFHRASPRRRPRLTASIFGGTAVLDSLESRSLLSGASPLSFPGTIASVASGRPIPDVTVNDTGAPDGIPITVSFMAQSSSGTLLPGAAVTATTTGGTATFKGLYFYGGTATNATPTAQSGDATTTSSAFNVTAGADQLFVSTAITGTVAGTALPDIKVPILDVNGNLVTSDNSTTLPLSIDHNPGNAQFVDANGNPVTAVPV